MKKNTEPLQPNTYYHVYNRGINGTRLFTKKGNTDYFLEKYVKYIEPIAETFAYVLMGNHFHFLIKTKSETEIRENIDKLKKKDKNFLFNVVDVQNIEDVKNDKPIHKILGNQFAKLFNSYAQSFNKQEKRTGGLFEESFRRIPINSDSYATHLVYYIHHNPVKHGFTDDFTIYLHSSYSIFLKNEPTFIQNKEVLSWFGGIEAFLAYHGTLHDFDEKWYQDNWIEVE
jgi:putative transposase